MMTPEEIANEMTAKASHLLTDHEARHLKGFLLIDLSEGITPKGAAIRAANRLEMSRVGYGRGTAATVAFGRELHDVLVAN